MEAFPINFGEAVLAKVSEVTYKGVKDVGGYREGLGLSLQALERAVESAAKADEDTYAQEAAGIEVGKETDPGMLATLSAVGVAGLEDPLIRLP